MYSRKLLMALMERDGDNPSSLAVKLQHKTKQPQIFKFLAGVSKEPRRSTLQPIADHYGLNIEVFYDEHLARSTLESVQKGAAADGYSGSRIESTSPSIALTGNPDYPAIRRVRFKLSAGASGFGVDYIDDDAAPIVFQREWFAGRGFVPSKLFAVKVINGSMEPGLHDGDVVVVNTGDTTIKDGEVYAMNYEGEMVIKRLVRDAGQWWLASDNPDQRRHPRKVCTDDVYCIGKIVHKQSERI